MKKWSPEKVRFAADVPAERTGGRGKFTTFLLAADIPALLRKGALESLGRQLRPPRNILRLGRRGFAVPSGVNEAGPGRAGVNVVCLAGFAGRES